ncbi:hypothetical protein AAEO56_17450 [Flavobacterium sp. DGU11]|uniref:Lipoprotein n=1 Tax=Flavobacterium arundinis TaxID=3139143 RepID=A0ABU9I0V9_9FLAO
MKPIIKTLFCKGLFVLLILMLSTSCITPRHTVEINSYVLMENGKEILGKEKGLIAFIFENNQRKMPFAQFVAYKYNLGTYTDVSYWVTVDGYRLKVFLYENAELEKYFDISQFMVSNVETEANIVGSKAKFLAMSVISESNEDCLADNSLYKNITIKYLEALKDEYNKS